jgi:hypothetical protein
MNIAMLTWFIVAGCVTYLISVDENVLTWLELQSKSAAIYLQRQWFLIHHNPDTPWVRWEINRNANRLAKKIQSEMETKRNDNL